MPRRSGGTARPSPQTVRSPMTTVPASGCRKPAMTRSSAPPSGLAEILGRAGVTEVVHDPRCTVEDPQLFSHRRDGVTGRQAGIVWLG